MRIVTHVLALTTLLFAHYSWRPSVVDVSVDLPGAATSHELGTVGSSVMNHRQGQVLYGRGGIDMSELDVQMTAGCEEGQECEMIEPLVTVELQDGLLDPSATPGGRGQKRFSRQFPPRAPRVTNTVVQDVSDAFFVWLLYPPESFWVNLSPTESDRIIENNLGRTDVGKVMLVGREGGRGGTAGVK